MKVTLTPQDDATLISTLPWRDGDRLRLESGLFSSLDYRRVGDTWREVGRSRITGGGGIASSYPMGPTDYSDYPPVEPSWDELGVAVARVRE